MITCITYGDRKYKNAGKLNLETALKHGADEVHLYGPQDVDFLFKIIHWKVYYGRYKSARFKRRGAGYWVWKPYVIKKALEGLEKDDILIYSDACSVYVNDIKMLIDIFNKDRLSVMVFALNTKEKKYSKKDALVLLGADEPKYIETNQRMATFIVLKNNEKSKKIINEWLKYSCDYRIITDSKSKLGIEYPEFKDNRHDQTILSILSKKAGIKEYRDPSQYGNNIKLWSQEVLDRSDYPQIWYSTRDPKIDSFEKLDLLNGGEKTNAY